MTSVTLISTASLDKYPLNNRSEFCNILPTVLENYNGHHKISLTRFNFENNFNTIRKKTVPDILLNVYRKDLIKGFYATPTIHQYQIFKALNENSEFIEDVIYIAIFLHSGKYRTLKELVESLNMVFWASGTHPHIFLVRN